MSEDAQKYQLEWPEAFVSRVRDVAFEFYRMPNTEVNKMQFRRSIENVVDEFKYRGDIKMCVNVYDITNVVAIPGSIMHLVFESGDAYPGFYIDIRR